MANFSTLTVNDTGYLQMPAGTTAQQQATSATVVQFTSVGAGQTWTCPAGVTQIEVLVVAGGGGGGRHSGGGGGGGGVIYRPTYQVTPGTVYGITVGAGGNGPPVGAYPTIGGGTGTNGGNSVFDTLTAIGGGAGGWNSANGASGGSGGGSTGHATYGPGAGTDGQGFAGAPSAFDGVGYASGGGGGAGGPGQKGIGSSYTFVNGATTVTVYPSGGAGGPGVFCNITGQERAYGGGGGGNIQYGGTNAEGGSGGSGVGGDGSGGDANPGGSQYGYDGVANTGGGGGGTHYNAPATATAGREGKGGSGIVVIRYNTSANQGSTPGSVRVNTTTNSLEYQNSGGAWSPNVMPFLTRTIISTHYVTGGYKDAVAWTNVNRCVANTDTTTNLGDSSLEAAHNYHVGACSKNLAYVFGAPNAHGTASNYIIAFNMRTEQQYASAGSRNLAVSTIYAGALYKEHYTAYISQGGYGGEVEEFNMITETLVGNCGVSRVAEAGWAMSDENYGIFYGSDSNSQNFHFATKTMSVRPGTHPSAHHQQKSVPSKLGKAWAGAEGSYNGGNNYRITNFVTNVTSGTVAKPTTNMGEENYTMGQDHQYCLGQYNGSGQVNVSHKFFYASQTGVTGTSTMEPKGHAGMSSATTGWRD